MNYKRKDRSGGNRYKELELKPTKSAVVKPRKVSKKKRAVSAMNTVEEAENPDKLENQTL